MFRCRHCFARSQPSWIKIKTLYSNHARSSCFSSSAISNYEPYLSQTSKQRKPSAIRRLQPLVSQPGMISLGGGLPNPSLFPFAKIQFSIHDPLGDNQLQSMELSPEEVELALQYSNTSGLPKLRDQLMELQQREHSVTVGGTGAVDRDITVTVGSQDGFCKSIEMLMDPARNEDQQLFLESPTYSGALSFLKPFGCNLVPVAMDGHGLIPVALEQALEQQQQQSQMKASRRILYTIPTAQNPSGVTLTVERRKEVYRIAQDHDMIILEDDPYYFLHPQRQKIPSFLEMDTDGRVLRFDSVSKLISSGLRIGFVTGPTALIEKLNFHMQATHLHNSGISQMMLQKVLEAWGMEGFDQHARTVTQFYDHKMKVLVAAAEKHLTGLAEWHVPDAGMFLWINLQHGENGGIHNTQSLIEDKAAKAKVLLVPGASFCPYSDTVPSPSGSYVRAACSTASDEDMDLAMERLADLIRSEQT